MPQPVQTTATLIALPAAANIAVGYSRAVRPGRRPFSDRLASKRQVLLKFIRALTNVTAITTPAILGFFGAEMPSEGMDFGVDASTGRRLPGVAPNASANGSPSFTGGYVERVKATTTTGTAVSAVGIGYIIVTNPGTGYTSAPAVSFSAAGGTAPTATSVIDGLGRVVGILVTSAGTGLTSDPIVTLAAPNDSNSQQATAVCFRSGFRIINTHIPYVANSPTTHGGVIWVAQWRDRLINCSSDVAPFSATAGLGAMDPDQHVVGGDASNGFTVATGTHPDGTTGIAVITLGLPTTNPNNFGIPTNDVLTVFRLPVRRIGPFSSVAAQVGVVPTPGLALMWTGCTVAGTIDTSTVTVILEPAT